MFIVILSHLRRLRSQAFLSVFALGWAHKQCLQFMLWSWGYIFPSVIQKCMVLLLEDLEAFKAAELDMSEIGRLADVFLSNSSKVS